MRPRRLLHVVRGELLVPRRLTRLHRPRRRRDRRGDRARVGGPHVAADPPAGGGMGDRAGVRAWDRLADPGGTGRVGGGTGRLTGSEQHGH